MPKRQHDRRDLDEALAGQRPCSSSKNQTETSSRAKPTTTRPITAPARNATRRPSLSDCLRGERRPGRGVRRHLHAEPAAQTREEPRDRHADRRPQRLDAREAENHQDRDEDHEHDRNDPVLPRQVRHRAVAHGLGDLDHVRVALAGRHDRAREDERHHERQDRAGRAEHVRPGVLEDGREISEGEQVHVRALQKCCKHRRVSPSSGHDEPAVSIDK